MRQLLDRLRAGRFMQAARAAFTAYQVDESVAARFRARQLQSVVRLTPLMMAANVLNVAIIVSLFWERGPRIGLVLWALGVSAVVVLALRGWFVARARPRATASKRALHRAAAHATGLGALWAAMPMLLFPSANGAQQLLLAVVTTGMLGAGGLALASTPVAATAYVLVIGVASALTLALAKFELASAVGALLAIYTVIVVGGIWATARLFGARLMAEAEAERQNEVIGLLLRDFEENASDVLWEVDAQGRFRHVSQRLARLFRKPADELAGLRVFDLLRGAVPHDEAGAGHLAALRRHIEARTPFRDLAFVVQVKGQPRWWSITAKPLADAQGRYDGWRGVAADVTETQHATRRLSWLANFDPLTGLANRHQFRSELERLVARGIDATQPFAVLFLDLDNFKSVNDTLGHPVGDSLLQEVAKRLLTCTRRSDTVARLGGDEFAIVLHHAASRDEVEQLARRVIQSLQAPCMAQGVRIAVGTSIGAALAPHDGSDIDALLNHADLALYAAKSAGRGGFRFFEAQMAAQTRRRLGVEQALRDALAQHALRLEFQPQIDLARWQVTGFEALLRWQHPQLGEVQPAEFVPVAEEAGLIQAIGEWVLDEACRHAAQWPAQLKLAVNVSPVQTLSQDLVRTALDALDRHGVAPDRLELEITESVFLRETPATMRTLHALRDAGMHIVLDDFGIGYSSLAYVRRFPFDALKIDRSFVRELLTRRDARAIVRTVVQLAQSLHMKTVAEGVEQPEHAGVLARYGCEAMQGFLVAAPMPPHEIAAFLRAWPHLPRPAAEEAPGTDLLPLQEPALP